MNATSTSTGPAITTGPAPARRISFAELAAIARILTAQLRRPVRTGLPPAERARRRRMKTAGWKPQPAHPQRRTPAGRRHRRRIAAATVAAARRRAALEPARRQIHRRLERLERTAAIAGRRIRDDDQARDFRQSLATQLRQVAGSIDRAAIDRPAAIRFAQLAATARGSNHA